MHRVSEHLHLRITKIARHSQHPKAPIQDHAFRTDLPRRAYSSPGALLEDARMLTVIVTRASLGLHPISSSRALVFHPDDLTPHHLSFTSDTFSPQRARSDQRPNTQDLPGRQTSSETLCGEDPAEQRRCDGCGVGVMPYGTLRRSLSRMQLHRTHLYAASRFHTIGLADACFPRTPIYRLPWFGSEGVYISVGGGLCE